MAILLPPFHIYEQHFDGVARVGVTGLLNRSEARVLAHEETLPDVVEALRRETAQTNPIFLWLHDDEGTLAPLLRAEGVPDVEYDDRACTHRLWPIQDEARIAAIQNALAGRELFIADGHHRYAAGWNLATVQIRSPWLKTHAAHRVLPRAAELPATMAVTDLHTFWAQTPAGHVRFGVIGEDGHLRGLELPHLKSERNVSVLNRLVLRGAPFQCVRGIDAALAAVRTGIAQQAFLLEPLSIDRIEADARRGALLPPKSTDFYPKLAEGLLIHTR